MAIRPARLALVCVVALIVAALAFMQAASSVLTRKQPVIAAQLFPLNGLAIEQLATAEFSAGVETEADIEPSAQNAEATARMAFARDPLVPKALAILAFGEVDTDAKRSLLGAATRLNRRDLLLQGLALEGHVVRRDYPATLDTLDSILRVHPEQKAGFFPVLMQALQDDAALTSLAGILDRSQEWHGDFLEAASRNPAAIPNLAKLRLSRDLVDPEVDRRLIEGLVAAGEIDQARRIYASATGQSPEALAKIPSMAWTSDLPPFDWKLADEAGFRAQLATSSPDLEIFVRGGKGGAVAERLIATPAGAFSVAVDHSLGPPDQIKDVRLQIRCPGQEAPLLDESFRVRPHSFRIPDLSARCEFVSIAVHARAWSGRPAIRGTINPLKISTR